MNHPTTTPFLTQVQDLRRTLNSYRQISRSNSDPAIRKVVGELQAAETALANHQTQLRADLIRQYQQQAQAAALGSLARNNQPVESIEDLDKKLIVFSRSRGATRHGRSTNSIRNSKL